MGDKYRITLSISFILAMLFVLPWLSLFEYAETFRQNMPEGRVRGRIAFLWVTTFASAILFFQYNFFWKHLVFLRNKSIRKGMDILINLALTVLLALALMILMRAIFQAEVSSIFVIIYTLRNLVIAFVCVLVVYAYEVSQRSKNDRIKLMTIKREKAETELAMLKNQLDPHFLFNSLNSLSGVIRKDQKEALQFVEHLSETFRYTLENRNDHLATLKDELQFLESYLYMMRMRFGNGLEVSIQVMPDDLIRRLPQHALQLLLENVIKHNVVSIKKPLKVVIHTNGRQLTVTNKLQPKHSPVKSHGIGLVNLRKRYGLLGYESVDVLRTETDFKVKLALL